MEPPRGTASDEDGWRGFGLSKPGLSRFLNRARSAVGLSGEVHVLLAGDATLRRLNRDFRGKNKSTDVLSFPSFSMMSVDTPPANPIAGDLAISLDTAARQAREFGHTLRDEVRILLLHGVLHLAGFDHEADSGEMALRESELRRELRLPAALIERVTSPTLPRAPRRPLAKKRKQVCA